MECKPEAGVPDGKVGMRPNTLLSLHLCNRCDVKLQSRLGGLLNIILGLYTVLSPNHTNNIKGVPALHMFFEFKMKLPLKIHFLSVSTSNSTNNFKGVLGILMEENAWHSKSMGEMIFHFTPGGCAKKGRQEPSEGF